MSGGLRLPGSVAAAMMSHARSEAPNEACGLVAGDRDAGVATRYHPARNSLASPTAFDVHPEDLVRILYEIERHGEDLVAIFHSHPRSVPVPSATDVRNARYPVPHLIASLAAPGRGAVPVMRAWRVEGQVVEVPIAVAIGDQQPDRSSPTTSSPESVTSTEQPPSSSPLR